MLFGANKLAGFLGRRYSLYLRPYCNKKGLCYEAHLFQYPLPSCQSILKISLLYLSIYSENLHPGVFRIPSSSAYLFVTKMDI